MTKIYILESDNDYSYKVVIHFSTLLGNNEVGISWKSAELEPGEYTIKVI